MSENTRITHEELTSGNNPNGKRKIKFAKGSYLAFKNNVRKRTYEAIQSRLSKKYEEEVSQLQDVVAKANELKRPNAEITAQVDKLMSLGVRIAKIDLALKRLEQAKKPKPIKIGKGFLKSVKQKYESIILDTEKEKLVSNYYNNFYNAREEFLAGREEGKTVGTNNFSDPRSFVSQPKAEPKKNANTHSIFANYTPPVGAPGGSQEQNSVEPEYAPPVYASTSVFSGEQDSVDKQEEAVTPIVPPTGEISVKGLPPASNVFSQYMSTSVQPTSYVDAFSQVSQSIHKEFGSDSAQLDINKPVAPEVPVVEDSKPITSPIDFSNLSSASTEELLKFAKACTTIVEEREAKAVEDQRVASIEANHDRVTEFHGGDDEFKFTPKQLAEIEKAEAERKAELQRQFEANEKIHRQEIFNALVKGELSPEQMKMYISMGIVSPEDISLKMQDPELDYKQIASLAAANAIAQKMANDMLERQNASGIRR